MLLFSSIQPVIHEISKPESLNTSMMDWYNTVLLEESGGQTAHQLVTTGPPWIDVRDLAFAHVRALQVQEAGGERIIVGTGKHKVLSQLLGRF